MKLPVLRVGSVGLEAHLQAPPRRVALGADGVAGEQVDGGAAVATVSLTPSSRSDQYDDVHDRSMCGHEI